ncbi:MAG: helix-turn-helix transcriptional regulator, partial [Lachnospiraceae bacterium]|nr:helix-turn-helix transcriptional regulator [Lachnospiraceae bacterium]
MKKLSVEKLVHTVTSLRKAKNMTQIQLADATGINRAMIGRIENKDYIPSVEQLQRLGEVLGFEVTDLFVDESAGNGRDAISLDRPYNIAVAGT